MFGLKFDKNVSVSDLGIIIALIVFFVRMDGRIDAEHKTNEAQSVVIEKTVDKLAALDTTVARLDERTLREGYAVPVVVPPVPQSINTGLGTHDTRPEQGN